MPNMTLAIDAQTMKGIRSHPEIRWSEVARQAFADKLQRLDLIDEMDKALANSTLTQRDVDKMAKEAKKRMLKRFLELRDAAGR